MCRHHADAGLCQLQQGAAGQHTSAMHPSRQPLYSGSARFQAAEIDVLCRHHADAAIGRVQQSPAGQYTSVMHPSRQLLYSGSASFHAAEIDALCRHHADAGLCQLQQGAAGRRCFRRRQAWGCDADVPQQGPASLLTGRLALGSADGAQLICESWLLRKLASTSQPHPESFMQAGLPTSKLACVLARHHKLTACSLQVMDYSKEKLSLDAAERDRIGSALAKAGASLEEQFGAPQDVEGAFVGQQMYIVQTRPQPF